MRAWPANLLLDEEAAVPLDAHTGTLTSGTNNVRTKSGDGYHGRIGNAGESRSATANRAGRAGTSIALRQRERSRPGNDHATVKPLALMEYLLTLLSTPDGGIILDPFAGADDAAGRPTARPALDRRRVERHNCEIAKSRLQA